MVEYIACPSCGRTLFNLEDVLHKVRNATSHLTGLDIAVMGCIVNGPGEMADADYGYVGKGPGIIALYRGREEIRKVPEKEGVQALIQLIQEDGLWVEPDETR
jgi:(E)-4-hydroxy-3-methylbut-2-enyl-diphosphate synthase